MKKLLAILWVVSLIILTFISCNDGVKESEKQLQETKEYIQEVNDRLARLEDSLNFERELAILKAQLNDSNKRYKKHKRVKPDAVSGQPIQR